MSHDARRNMTEQVPDNFDGFITRDGELLSITDVDGVFSYLARRHDKPSDISRALWSFGEECRNAGHFGVAGEYYEKILLLEDEPSERAKCLLAIGMVGEKSGDFVASAKAYARAFELEQEPNFIWYFLNNNLGFSLNQLGRHKEAVRYCRAALKIDRRRHNAHKNLGVALEGLGRYAEAARSYLRAAKINPGDGRALNHLKHLLSTHPEMMTAGLRRALSRLVRAEPSDERLHVQ
jgi:tetratricopeptide (TPR) repeat protein